MGRSVLGRCHFSVQGPPRSRGRSAHGAAPGRAGLGDPARAWRRRAGRLAGYAGGGPGGSSARAEALFAQAIAAGGGRNAGVYVGKAESLAQPAGDRAAFEALLRQALAVPGNSLGNQVMRVRAQWLLDSADDLF